MLESLADGTIRARLEDLVAMGVDVTFPHEHTRGDEYDTIFILSLLLLADEGRISLGRGLIPFGYCNRLDFNFYFLAQK